MTEQGAATSLLLTKQGAITSSLREDRAIQSGNQVLAVAVYCAEEATQSENTATAAVSSSMTEIGSTCNSHCVGQLCQMIGYPNIVEDTGNAMGSTGIYNRHAQEEPEGDTEKDEISDFEAEPEALCQDASPDVFALSLSPRDKGKEISRFRKFYIRKGKKQVNTSATECNGQLTVVHTEGELPTLHNGDSGLSVMGNVRNGMASIGMNDLDGEVLASTYEGCSKTSLGNAIYGRVSDNSSECCMVEGCTNGAHGGTSLCTFHNSRPLKRCCAVIGCTTAACMSSQGRTDRCVKHGGGKRCKYDGCGKGAQGKTDYCIAHGGGRRCKIQGCRKSAQGKTDYCIQHGGGRRCKFLGCRASATYGKDFCSMHTSLLSGNNSSREILQARRAKKAEPSKGRNSCSVIGGRAQKRQNTNDYVNTRSFNVIETAEEKGRVFVCQNNMLKARQTTHGMNSESGLAEGSPPRKFRKLAEVYT